VEAAEEGGEVILGAWALVVIVLYPFFVLAVFLASFMAAWDTHLFMAFVYWGLTAFFLPWWRNPAYKKWVSWFLTLQGGALFWTALVAALAK
jgi:hypothetical protein